MQGSVDVMGSRGFSSFGVDNINFSSPDDHFPSLDFIFSFEPFYDGGRDDVFIDETKSHRDTALIAEAPEFSIMAMTDKLSPHHILSVMFGRSTFTFIVDFYPPVFLSVIFR